MITCNRNHIDILIYESEGGRSSPGLIDETASLPSNNAFSGLESSYNSLADRSETPSDDINPLNTKHFSTLDRNQMYQNDGMTLFHKIP